MFVLIPFLAVAGGTIRFGCTLYDGTADGRDDGHFVFVGFFRGGYDDFVCGWYGGVFFAFGSCGYMVAATAAIGYFAAQEGFEATRKDCFVEGFVDAVTGG